MTKLDVPAEGGLDWDLSHQNELEAPRKKPALLSPDSLHRRAAETVGTLNGSVFSDACVQHLAMQPILDCKKAYLLFSLAR